MAVHPCFCWDKSIFDEPVPIPDSAGEALPAQHDFGLEDTDNIPELICGLARRLLELGGQNGQGQFLYLAGFDRVIEFTLQDG